MLFAGLAGTATACRPFDASQVPVVAVGRGLRPSISWSPGPAYKLMMYPGAADGDGFGVLWSVAGSGDYENHLHSPVTYGVPPDGSDFAPAPPLEAGKTYTVTVTRKDERGSGDGFFNTRHRYVGTHTFVAAE